LNKSRAKHPPSDDQDPTTVYFLAVKPGATLAFPFRVDADAAAFAPRVRPWLKQGLDTWGAGAKTTAGYGYFSVPGSEAKQEGAGTGGTKEIAKKPPASKAPGHWSKEIWSITSGNVNWKIPQILNPLEGEERKLAAQTILERHEKRFNEPSWRLKEGVRLVLRILEEKPEVSS
jgi:hypothetical protein